MYSIKLSSYILILCVLFSPSLRAVDASLEDLEKELAYELKLLDYPPESIKEIDTSQGVDPVIDVAIIGGGMAGLAAGVALFKEGVFNIRLFDQNPSGQEGPWITYARMRTLRSPKEDMGPALGIPRLTFRAWYEAQFGREAWRKVYKIPNQQWMEYLNWFRRVMQLPVENNCTLVAIHPDGEDFLLEFRQDGETRMVKTHRIVLATGRGGFGGPIIPEFVKNLSATHYSHVMGSIEVNTVKGKKIGVVGAGSSAFDAAAFALENGAERVELIMRSSCLPCVNKFSSLPDHCYRLGYYHFPDAWRWRVMNQALSCTIPPPVDSLKRVQGYNNFFVKTNVSIRSAQADGAKVVMQTNQGALTYDFLILGTGYEVNGKKQPELREFADKIALWEDRNLKDQANCYQNFGLFPYLGPAFEFNEKVEGEAPFLKRIYCFNFASIMSQGMLGSAIGSISYGAVRLAQGIASGILQEQADIYLKLMEEYDEKDFKSDEYLPHMDD